MTDPKAVPLSRVSWGKTYRIIRSIFPPVDLFEDIADPADWEALASAEAKTNPRVWDKVGNLSMVPAERRVGGPGASLLMAPFLHCSIDRPGRLSDGSYGVYHAADREEVAIREVAFHHGEFMAATDQAPGWTSQFQVLVGSVEADLHDISECPGALDPGAYSRSQEIARTLRAAGSNGVVYPSVRAQEGMCIGVFWPDILPIPVQGDHYELFWDGAMVTRGRNLSTQCIFAL
ncbi:RES domain-containing protein [Palleronia aestuarii]|uniref:RES domain-containing protein n=1 Tax=Palleronia aestuarii TaxID=568105 RepID=A0A2W7MNT7_9RHOB|nr:RES family NAD+ phosphorylase [Palleronia aestuarii]PZX09925.1 RES domain-containing protein [Palleronia aestuarii]